MSLALLARVFATPMDSSTDKIVLLALADYAWEDGTRCYPSVQRIMAHCSLTRRPVQEALRRLETAGFIVPAPEPSPLGTTMWALEVGRLELPGGQSARPPGGAPQARGGALHKRAGGAPQAPNPLFTPQLTPQGRGRALPVSPLVVNEWIAELSRAEAYQRLDVRAVVLRCEQWCQAHGKVATRARLVNWLNKDAADLLPATSSNGTRPGINAAWQGRAAGEVKL